MRRRHEPRITLSAPSSPRDDNLITVVEHLAEELARLLIANDGPRRNGQYSVRSRGARFVRAGAIVAVLGFPLVSVRVVQEGAQVAVAADAHVAASAAISPV